MPRFKSNKAAPSAQKARGGYYTPRVLADCLCRWAIRSPSEKVLEPSCGDGSFLDAAGRLLDEHGRITAVELVAAEIERAQQRMNGAPMQLDWRCASFFDLLAGPAYDVVVGNPPFIRFQYFDKDERARAFGFARSFGYRPNGWRTPG